MTSEAAADDVRRRVTDWSQRVDAWVAESSTVAQRAEIRERTRRVREEAAVAKSMLPARRLARPLLVIVPEES